MKYKVGDYITAEDLVFLEVMVTIDGDVPVYLLRGPGEDITEGDGRWFTEKEIEIVSWEKKSPDFDRWAKLKAGDMVRQNGGLNSDGSRRQAVNYKVIVRINDAVLLSLAPHNHKKEERQNSDLLKQLRELSDSDEMEAVVKVVDNMTKPKIHPYAELLSAASHTRQAYDMAGEWYTVHDLALRNWELLSE